jgi:hypothetical protein
MFKASFVGSIMNMKADIYTQQNTQDPNTGQITRQWQYESTISCKIEPISSSGTYGTSHNKSFSNGQNLAYTEKMQLIVYSTKLMSKRWRIQNIRSNDNKQVFVEIDKYDAPDTIFEVISSHGVLDPFGKISHYVSNLLRTELQDDSQS